MLNLPASVRIYLATEPTDMRKGFYGLGALVSALHHDVYCGHLFVFVSRRGDRIKILSWDRGGFVLWYKRLERGKFKLPPLRSGQRTVQLDAGQLGLLIDGIDFSRVRRPPRWEPRQRRIDNRAAI